jgi:hypothetical protein
MQAQSALCSTRAGQLLQFAHLSLLQTGFAEVLRRAISVVHGVRGTARSTALSLLLNNTVNAS